MIAVIAKKLHDRALSQKVGPYPFFIGIIAALGMVGFYLGLLTLTSDWYNAKMQFSEYRGWILALSFGLGVQATLFSFMIKRLQRSHMKGAKATLFASGGMSTASMAACCAHYLISLLPILSLPFFSAAAAGLVEHQRELFFLGVLSNLFGIVVMIRVMQKNGIITIRSFMENFRPGS